MTLLGLETSCDETAASVVRGGKILSNVVSTQVEWHAPHGGVVPEVASRQHLRRVDGVVVEALKQADVTAQELEAIAVTRGPGLPSALLVGVSAARGLATRLNLPLLPVHHIEAHLYSVEETIAASSFVALVVSGGHTLLWHVERFGCHRRLGGTADDAAGEALDKAAQLMGLGYPGGPAVESAARMGNAQRYDFPRPMLDSGDWNFSFSGLKSSLRRTVIDLKKREGLSPNVVTDLCASFQAAVFDVLVEKTVRAARSCGVSAVALAGGVACNQELRRRLEKACKGLGWRFACADKMLCTDNAAMVALLAEKKWALGWRPEKQWDIAPDWVL